MLTFDKSRETQQNSLERGELQSCLPTSRQELVECEINQL